MSREISTTLTKSRVLVVDDESEIRRLLCIGLEAYGYDVIEARSGETALQQSVTAAPQIVILDLGLPDMEGYEVVRQLREWSQIPVSVLSVRSGVDDKIARSTPGPMITSSSRSISVSCSRGSGSSSATKRTSRTRRHSKQEA